VQKNGAIACLLAAVVGSHTATAEPLPESGELLCSSAHLGNCDFTDNLSGLQLLWPRDWPSRRLKVDTVTGPAANSRQRDALRWISVEYLPDDAAQPEVSLVRVAVLRRQDWLAVARRPVPPAEVEVGTNHTYVAVATVLPQNPYPPGSLDAEIYDALVPSFAEVSRIVRFPSTAMK
jgi:hypothetical protein